MYHGPGKAYPSVGIFPNKLDGKVLSKPLHFAG
jgi:hypothetical protein